MLEFTEEHSSIRNTVRRFIEAEVNPHADEWEEAEEFPTHELFKKAGAVGILGITKPLEYGGLALDYSYSAVYAEELGHSLSGGIATAFGVQTDMATPALAKRGSDALRAEFLAPAVAGNVVACIGVSEVGAGSDVASIKTAARKDRGDYVINGGKMWISNGIKADWMCLLANTDPDNGPHKNKSLIIVPMNTPGVQRARKLKKMGVNSDDTAQIFFDDVRVPQRYCIGEEGRGFIYQMEQFAEERMFAVSRTTSQLQDAIDATIEYTKERQAFGRRLIDNQWIHYTLAELATEVESLRALNYHCIEAYVAGKDVRLLSAMAKLKVGKVLRQVPDTCMQFWGGAGYLRDSRINRILRDTRLVAIGGGANEVMMQVIAKELGMIGEKGRK